MRRGLVPAQFTHHLFELEQSEYEREGIDWTKVEFVDNQDCVDVFELRVRGAAWISGRVG